MLHLIFLTSPFFPSQWRLRSNASRPRPREPSCKPPRSPRTQHHTRLHLHTLTEPRLCTDIPCTQHPANACTLCTRPYGHLGNPLNSQPYAQSPVAQPPTRTDGSQRTNGAFCTLPHTQVHTRGDVCAHVHTSAYEAPVHADSEKLYPSQPFRHQALPTQEKTRTKTKQFEEVRTAKPDLSQPYTLTRSHDLKRRPQASDIKSKSQAELHELKSTIKHIN